MSTMKFCKGLSLGLVIGVSAGMCIAANNRECSKMMTKRHGKRMVGKARHAMKDIVENIADAIGQ